MEILESEIRSRRNSVVSLVRTRKVHPSYGVTKKQLREELSWLEGMLFAHHVMLHGERSASILLAARLSAKHLEIDLDELRRIVDEA